MPDPAISAALAEAYASAPAGLVILDTLEVWHPAFNTPLRIVADNRALDARLEPTAPRDPGADATFVPLAFRLRLPEVSTEAPGIIEAEIDTVGREIVAEIDRAVLTTAPIEIIYRRYIDGTAASGPEYVMPGLTLRTVTATPTVMRATAGWHDLVNERFPRLVYERSRFPALEAGL